MVRFITDKDHGTILGERLSQFLFLLSNGKDDTSSRLLEYVNYLLDENAIGPDGNDDGDIYILEALKALQSFLHDPEHESDVLVVSDSDLGMVIADKLVNVVVKLELRTSQDVCVKFAENMGHYIEEMEEAGSMDYDQDLIDGMKCFRRYALKKIGK